MKGHHIAGDLLRASMFTSKIPACGLLLHVLHLDRKLSRAFPDFEMCQSSSFGSMA